MVNDKLTVSELASTALVALPPIVLIRQLAETMRSCRHAAFPVTPGTKAAYQSGFAPRAIYQLFPKHKVIAASEISPPH